VLRYLPTNLSGPEIAGELYVSHNTVRTHITHLYAKLGTHTRAAPESGRQTQDGDFSGRSKLAGKTTAKGSSMADNVYSVSEIVGSSSEGIDDAVRGAIGRASKTLHNLDWFEDTGMRGRIDDDGRCNFQVTLKVGFRLDERPA